MKAKLVVRDGLVYIHDEDTHEATIAMTPTIASWLSFFLQQHLTTELIVQLRLAANYAETQRTNAALVGRDFQLQRS